MGSRGMAGILVRQGLLLLVLLALTALATCWVGRGIAPRYEVKATAAVLAGTGTYSGQEVYGSLAHTNQVLAIMLNATSTREQMARSGLEPDYVVTARERRTYLHVLVRSPSADLGLRTADSLLDMGRQELDERQSLADTPLDARYTLSTLRPPTITSTVPWRVRNMAITAVLGTTLSVILTVRSRPLLQWLGSVLSRDASKGRHRS